jgi:hypothetical protein
MSGVGTMHEDAGMRRTLTNDHEAPNRPPLHVHAGEVVCVGDRDTEWPAFVFVTTDAGSGWVPARHIDADGTMLRDYDTVELTLPAGTTVDVIEDDPESRWAWCRAADGREGWIPHRAFGEE